MRDQHPDIRSNCSLNTNLDGHFDALEHAIIRVTDPIDPQDVATRAYVDRNGNVAEVWVCDSALDMQTPTNGTLRFNRVDAEATTQLAISSQAENGVDYARVFESLIAGDQLYLQMANNAATYTRYELPAAPVAQPAMTRKPSGGPWWLCDVTPLVDSGHLIVNKSRLLITFLRVGNTVTKASFDALRAQVMGA